MLVSELTPKHVGQTIILGANFKKRRGIIREVGLYSTYTRVTFQGNGTRSLNLPLDAEIEVDPEK